MYALRRPAVVTGDVAPGVGRVAAHGVPEGGQQLLDGIGEGGQAAGAVPVAEDDVHPFAARIPVHGTAHRGHRMAVDEHRVAEGPARRVQQVGEGAMEGQVELVDAPHGIRETKLAGIDLGVARDDAGDGPEAPGHPVGPRVHVVRQLFLEHRRVELPGFPVDVHVGARKVGADQGSAAGRRALEQLVDETVFGPSQVVGIEARGREKVVRIVGAAVRRGEDARRRRPSRREHLERWRGDIHRRLEHGSHDPTMYGAALPPASESARRTAFFAAARRIAGGRDATGRDRVLPRPRDRRRTRLLASRAVRRTPRRIAPGGRARRVGA